MVQESFELPEQVLVNEETRMILEELLDELQARQRAVVFEYYYNDLTISEISKAYGMMRRTVRRTLTRARKLMKRKLACYEKNTGVQLYAVSLAPLFYRLFQDGIQNTLQTSVIPKGIAALFERL